MLPEVWRPIAALQPLPTNTPTAAKNRVGISSMYFSRIDSTPKRGTDKSLGDEIGSGQSLQSFLPNSVIASSVGVSHISRSPHLSLALQDERSPKLEAHQLDLLILLEKSLESALRIEAVPTDIAVGSSEKFWLIHQNSQLRVPGQFTSCEAKEILKVTAGWDWTVDLKTREPACRYQLLNLLNRVCTPQKALEVAV